MIIGRPQHETEARTKLIRSDFARLDTDTLREELFNKQSGKCFWCRRDLNGWDSISCWLDHYTSVYELASRRDLSDAEAVLQANLKTNFVLAHPACNKAKDMIDADEFVEQLQSGKIVLGEPRKWTLEDIEAEKQRLSERGRKGGRATNAMTGGRKGNGGRIGGRKNVETGHLASIASKGGKIGGRIQGRKAVETGQLASISSKGGRVRGPIQGRKNVETGHLTRIATFETRSKGGRKNVETGQLASIASKGGRVSNHLRWHVKRGIKKVGCSFCFPKAEL